MYKPHIAIIDDGVSEKLYKIGKLKHNIQVTSELKICERVDYDPFMPSHGTTCAAIINKYAPETVLSSIKILDGESHTGMKAQLIKALKWCADNGIRLVNLSLGTIDYRDFNEIRESVSYAREKGVVIVAACNNRNIFTCPASLGDVIGVRCDCQDKLGEKEYIYNQKAPDGIEITANGCHKLEKSNGESKTTSMCNSYAAPLITALVYEIIRNNPDILLPDIREKLRKASILTDRIEMEKSLPCNHTSYSMVDRNMDAPVIALYNYCGKESEYLGRKLTDAFRKDGYNAINISEGKTGQDYCAGYINISSFIENKGDSLNGAIQRIFNVFDPDIMLVSVDMANQHKQNCINDMESNFETDININVYENLKIEIKSSNEARTFALQGDLEIDGLYSYITGLFAKHEYDYETAANKD